MYLRSSWVVQAIRMGVITFYIKNHNALMDINTARRLAFVSQFSQWIKTASAFALKVRLSYLLSNFPGSCFTRQFCRSYSSFCLTGKHMSGLLCIMVWFLDELFHNSCHERMTCCLIHVMSEWGPFGSVYWVGLPLSMWTSEFMVCSTHYILLWSTSAAFSIKVNIKEICSCFIICNSYNVISALISKVHFL